MDKINLTGPQQAVYDFVAKHGAVETAHLKSRGLDVRAANNLVKFDVLTLTNNVYRIKTKRRVAKQEEALTEASTETAPVSQPPEVAPAGEAIVNAAAQAANDTAVVGPVEAAPGSEKAPETATEGSKKAKKDKAAKAPRAKKTVTNATGHCLCGCGTELGPKRRFALGHDAKLHSIVLKVARGQVGRGALPEACFDKTSPTMAYLRGAPWMTDEIREAIGL
jgi:hypothetical protein